jgi:hypothetical protein
VGSQGRGTERYGIVVSSEAQWLWAYAIDVRTPRACPATSQMQEKRPLFFESCLALAICAEYAQRSGGHGR